MKRNSQNLMELALLCEPVLWERSVIDLWSRMEMGSRGGLPAKVLLTVSRQNCMRNCPIVGFETVSGRRASSRLRVRKAS